MPLMNEATSLLFVRSGDFQQQQFHLQATDERQYCRLVGTDGAFWRRRRWIMPFACASLLLLGAWPLRRNKAHKSTVLMDSSSLPLLGKEKFFSSAPAVQKRCDWLLARFQERNTDATPQELKLRYEAQSTDPNVFYRATALIFWQDYAVNKWGAPLQQLLFQQNDNKHALDPLSTYTWVTGDQHLSNFGAWRNRHDDIVFGVNDFDEAAIYDFQVDILRIAVSVCNHAVTNELSHKQTKKALKAFAESYIKAVLNYVDNEKALLFELTPKTAYGMLDKYLRDVQDDESIPKQLEKFTLVNRTTSSRQFRKGPVNMPHDKTNLAAVSAETDRAIRNAFTSTHYGATLMKIGWNVHGTWDPDFFSVLDVAERVGSGIGSFGVDRYFVLLKGKDRLLDKGSREHGSIILDVKYQPPGAVTSVLSLDETAWYQVLFANDAARVVEAQRRLTSYTDPYTGWIMLPDASQGTLQPFSIRQRSPWKDSPDLDDLTDPDDFIVFMEQVAVATATSHVRGSVAKAPGDFKHVIQSIFKKDEKMLKVWVDTLVELAFAYREQVLLDFECVEEFVKDTNMNNTTV